ALRGHGRRAQPRVRQGRHGQRQGANRARLRSDEYGAIKADYDRISREHFAKSYAAPAGRTFAMSDAPFPPAELRAVIAMGFEAQCRVLCFGPFPSCDEVQARLEEIRGLL